MLNLIYLVLMLVLSIWVYIDATNQSIGKLDDDSYFDFSAGGWAFLTLFMGVLTVPIYLLLRKKLIEKAKKTPVVVKSRNLRLALIGVAILFFASNVVLSHYFPVSPEQEKAVKAWVDQNSHKRPSNNLFG